MAISGSIIRAAVLPRLNDFIRRGWSPNRTLTHIRETFGGAYRTQLFYDDFIEAKARFDFRPIWKTLDPSQPVMREFFAPRSSAIEKKFAYEYQYSYRDVVSGEQVTGTALFSDDTRLSPQQALVRAEAELQQLLVRCPPLLLTAENTTLSGITGYFEIRDPRLEAGRRARRTARGDIDA